MIGWGGMPSCNDVNIVRRAPPPPSTAAWACAAPRPTTTTPAPAWRLNPRRHVAEATPTSPVVEFATTIDQVADARAQRRGRRDATRRRRGRSARGMATPSGRSVVGAYPLLRGRGEGG